MSLGGLECSRLAKTGVGGCVLVTVKDLVAFVIEVLDSVTAKYEQFGV
jgi:hypothetical protein